MESINSRRLTRRTSIIASNAIKTANKENFNFSKIISIMQLLGFAILVLFIIHGFKMGIFTSQLELSRFIKSWGIFAPVAFVIFQVIQVVVPVLPGGISSLIGAEAFGNLMGFIYNYIGIVAGSLIAFLLSRKYGTSLVKAITKPSIYKKYNKWVTNEKNFDKWFALAIFFPMAPDDFLCYLAGVTKISLKKFTFIILIGKPLGIFAYTWILKYSIHSLVNIFVR